MKKLMTMLAAVATAFGLYAADPVNYGTSFEGLTAGTSIFDAETEGANWVKSADPNATALVADYADGEGKVTGEARPAFFVGETQNQYLNVKTALGSPITRKLDTAWDLATGNFYVDTLVKFTNFEDAPENIDGKVAVWVQEIDNGDNTITTNLMVTAGSDATGTRKDYLVRSNWESSANQGGWARVTIKAIPAITTKGTMPGFAIWVDKSPIGSTDSRTDINAMTGVSLTDIAKSYNKEGNLFLSMDQGTAAISTVNAVAFDGQGQIDDVSLTSVAPTFAADPQFFFIEAGDANVKSIKVDGAAYNFGDPLELTANPQDFTIDATYETGFIDGVWTATEGATADAANHKFTVTAGGAVGTVVAKAALVKIGENSYGSLAEALADKDALKAAAGQVEIAGALTLDGTVTVPAVDGVDAVVIDLVGNTITYEGEGYAFAAVGPLTITDSTDTPGTIDSAAGVVTSAANLTINKDVTLDGPVAITAGTGAISAGIFEDTFQSATAGVVTGGKFTDDPTAYLATGYKAPYDEATGYYIVGIGVYDITYYDEDGQTVLTGLTPSTYTYNQDELVLPDGPVKTGKTFKEWQDASGEKFVYVKGMAEDIEVAAYYEASTYTIKFLDKDNQQIGDAQTVEYNELPEVPEAPVVTGMSFKGWDPEVAAATKDQDYKATYTANVYQITYTYVDDKGENVDVTNTNPTEFTFGVGASFDATKLTYDTAAYENPVFSPTSIGTDVAQDTPVTVTFTKKQGGWSPDPSKDEGKAASEVYPVIAASKLANVDAGKLGAWAAKNSIEFADFTEDPDTFENAFLLDCKLGEVEEQKKAFKFDEIVPGEQPTIGEGGKYGNGKVVVYGATKLGDDADWEINKEGATFYKAELVPISFNENK